MSKSRWLTAGDLMGIGLAMIVVGILVVVMSTPIMRSVPLVGLGVGVFAQGVIRMFRR